MRDASNRRKLLRSRTLNIGRRVVAFEALSVLYHTVFLPFLGRTHCAVSSRRPLWCLCCRHARGQAESHPFSPCISRVYWRSRRHDDGSCAHVRTLPLHPWRREVLGYLFLFLRIAAIAAPCIYMAVPTDELTASAYAVGRRSGSSRCTVFSHCCVSIRAKKVDSN